MIEEDNHLTQVSPIPDLEPESYVKGGNSQKDLCSTVSERGSSTSGSLSETDSVLEAKEYADWEA